MTPKKQFQSYALACASPGYIAMARRELAGLVEIEHFDPQFISARRRCLEAAIEAAEIVTLRLEEKR